jgi:tetratricopeptide (TPR) repeat protein
VDQAANRLSEATQFANDGIEFYNRNNWSAAHERFQKALEIEPGLNTPYIYRGELYTTLGLWDRAAADYDRRFHLASRAQAQTWYEYAVLKRYTGDEAGYRHACRELIRQHSASAEIRSRYYVVRSCVLGEMAASDAADLVHKAERLVADARAPWHLGLAGRAHLLAGDFKQAAERCREAITLGTGSPAGVHRINNFNLAIALARQSKQADAQEALARGEQARDEWIKMMEAGLVGTMPVSWADWLEGELHYREAKTLISGSPPSEDPRLTSLRERGLATITYGDVFSFMDVGRQHVQRGEWDEAAHSFVTVLDKLPAGFRASSQEMRFCIEMVQMPQVFERLVKLRPVSRHLWFARGRSYASSREWAKAATDYEKSLELLKPALSTSQAELGPWLGWGVTQHEMGALLLLVGDETAYQELASSIVTVPVREEEPIVLSCLSRTCTMTPSALTDFEAPLMWARRAVEKQPRVAWHLYALGIAEHRADQHEEAIQSLQRSLSVNKDWVGRGQNYATLALACHSLGRDSEARQWLSQTRSWLNEVNRTAATWKFGFASTDYLSDWLCGQVLLSEAEKLLANGRSP